MDIHDLAAHFEYATPQSGGYRLRCPAHDDRQASLMLHVGRNGGLVLNCHAGCKTEDVLAAIGRDMSDLRGEQEATVMPFRGTEILARYSYTDVNGQWLHDKVRARTAEDPKKFWWEPRGVKAADRVLYRLQQLPKEIAAGKTIYVVEGEKDVHTLVEAGFAATTCGSAGGWTPTMTGQLRGAKHVVVIADDDDPGHKHAVKVAQALITAGIEVDLTLPMAGFNDITDQFEAGHTTLDVLRGLGADVSGGMFTRMSDVTVAPPRWAWLRHFALGALSYIEGDPGVSKSTVTCDLAARWTTGRLMPDGSPNEFGGPVTVAMLTAEDSLEHTMGPRLIAAGADMSKVLAITAGPDGEPFSLANEDHLAALRAGLKTHGVRVLVIDPLPAFLGEKTDTFKDSAVRVAMLPLTMMAAELGVAIVVVRHFNKGTGGKAIHKGGGSIGFAGAARAVFQISRHPDEESQYIFANAKNNLAKAQPSLTYTLVPDAKTKAISPEFDIASVQWLGISDMCAQDVLDAVVDDDAKGLLKVMVDAAKSGPKTWKTISEVLDDAGYSPRTAVKYRKRVLELVYGPNGNADAKWRVRNAPEPKPKRRNLAVVKDAAPSADTCDQCGKSPAVYFAAPVSEFRCQAHAKGLL